MCVYVYMCVIFLLIFIFIFLLIFYFNYEATSSYYNERIYKEILKMHI